MYISMTLSQPKGGGGVSELNTSRDVGSAGPRKALRCLDQTSFLASLFGDKCPQIGSKNGQRASRTGMGYPHEGPYVVGSAAGPARSS